jgi:hypothetical protein
VTESEVEPTSSSEWPTNGRLPFSWAWFLASGVVTLVGLPCLGISVEPIFNDIFPGNGLQNADVLAVFFWVVVMTLAVATVLLTIAAIAARPYWREVVLGGLAAPAVMLGAIILFSVLYVVIR